LESALRFGVWTINKPDRIIHYKNLGVDGIISDRPDLVRKLLSTKGSP